VTLVDTSVWVDHFRRRNAELADLLDRGDVLGHPWIVGELACGHLRRQREILALLAALPQARSVEDEEVLHFIETRRLFGKGIGWVDAHLLASVALTGATLWTLDRALARAAAPLRLAIR
jgi:predicted nucleic acid-binding protein